MLFLIGLLEVHVLWIVLFRASGLHFNILSFCDIETSDVQATELQ